MLRPTFLFKTLICLGFFVFNKPKSLVISVISDTVLSYAFSYVELEEVGMLQLRHCFGKQRKDIPL